MYDFSKKFLHAFSQNKRTFQLYYSFMLARYILTCCVLFFLCREKSYSQTHTDLQTLKTEYQSCLDKGENMLACSSWYYMVMDSMLNLAYKNLRAKCDSVQKENLKDEQLDWLAKRDQQVAKDKKRIHAQAVKEGYEGGQIECMFLEDTCAHFEEYRVRDLIKKTPSDYSPQQYQVAAVGTYSMDNSRMQKGERYGRVGTIKVKPLGKNKLLVSLYVCKGAPSYNSGSFLDTLGIVDNQAIYTCEYDSTCRIVFRFYKRGVDIEQFADDPNTACGFGHAVFADGFYRKKSARVPSAKELKEEQWKQQFKSFFTIATRKRIASYFREI